MVTNPVNAIQRLTIRVGAVESESELGKMCPLRRGSLYLFSTENFFNFNIGNWQNSFSWYEDFQVYEMGS